MVAWNAVIAEALMHVGRHRRLLSRLLVHQLSELLNLLEVELGRVLADPVTFILVIVVLATLLATHLIRLREHTALKLVTLLLTFSGQQLVLEVPHGFFHLWYRQLHPGFFNLSGLE